MSYEILTKSYGRRLPKITATATSTDDLAALGTDYAEGSTCAISDTTYKLDKVQGWVDPSSQPSGGDDVFIVNFTYDLSDESNPTATTDKSGEEVDAAEKAGKLIMGYLYAVGDGEAYLEDSMRYCGGGSFNLFRYLEPATKMMQRIDIYYQFDDDDVPTGTDVTCEVSYVWGVPDPTQDNAGVYVLKSVVDQYGVYNLFWASDT